MGAIGLAGQLFIGAWLKCALEGRNVLERLKLHQPIVRPVLKTVKIADDDYRAKPYLVWLGPGPFQQIAADLTDFVPDHGLAPNGPLIAKSRYHNSKIADFPLRWSYMRFGVFSYLDMGGPSKTVQAPHGGTFGVRIRCSLNFGSSQKD